MGSKVFYATDSAFMQSPHTRVCLLHPTPIIRVPCLGSTRNCQLMVYCAYAGGLSLPHTRSFLLRYRFPLCKKLPAVITRCRPLACFLKNRKPREDSSQGFFC